MFNNEFISDNFEMVVCLLLYMTMLNGIGHLKSFTKSTSIHNLRCYRYISVVYGKPHGLGT